MRKLLVLCLVLLLVSCRQSAQPTPTPTTAVEIDLAVEPTPISEGEAALVITLRAADGTPINEALVSVRGDMNHAGMTPVLGETSASENGVYRVPFEFTMTGDWIITVTAALPSGGETSQTFDLTVQQ
jgi:hypothetical protein